MLEFILAFWPYSNLLARAFIVFKKSSDGYMLYPIRKNLSSMDKIALFIKICFIYKKAHLFVKSPKLSYEKDLYQILQIKIYFIKSAADFIDAVLK